MCTKPLTAFVNPEGGRPIFGYQGVKLGLTEMHLPCGKCSECTKEYYQSWAARGSLELKKWETSLFLTLTYDDTHLPGDYSLNKKDVQDFIKRLKKAKGSSKEDPIRQIYCGEYGTQTLRPHYHVILFNCDFKDKKQRAVSSGMPVYESEQLTKLWGKGFAQFGYADAGAIGYLFKYILKKKTKKEKETPLYHEHDGCIYEKSHEFIEASRNPGIGAFSRDSASLAKGFTTNNGVKTKLSKYYLNYLKLNEPTLFEKISGAKVDFYLSKPKESAKEREMREEAKKLLTDTKRRIK